MRVAIIGSGIAGLGAAWLLRHTADVTIFEKNDRIGGHSHTVMADGPNGLRIPVDTGFIVYNEVTYPNLVKLLEALNVETIASDMSFAASLDNGQREYAGDSLFTLIGQWRNLFSVRHWRMVIDLVRFLKHGSDLVSAPAAMTLGEFLVENRYSQAFRKDHLLPLAGAIWSMTPDRVMDFPARSFGNFFRNHGLLELDTKKRPQWRTIAGGSQNYVRCLAQDGGATIVTGAAINHVSHHKNDVKVHFHDGSIQKFDHVILAIHADEALALLPEESYEARAFLSAFSYSSNDAYLHSDEALMPSRKRLWASWNYMRSQSQGQRIFLSYWMNRLQNIDRKSPLFVTLNPPFSPAANKTILHQIYHHPQFDLAAITAQSQLRHVQGKSNIWLCGSYFGYGFHEDALASGFAVAVALGAAKPWSIAEVSPAFANATPVSANE